MNAKEEGASILDNVDDIMEKYLPEAELKAVKRILYGNLPRELGLPSEAVKMSAELNLQLRSFAFDAEKEISRPPRVVRVGLVQMKSILPTDAPIAEQRSSLHCRMAEVAQLAHLCDVNLLALQEAWTMPFAFCTREKIPWCEFAEDALTGPTTQLCQEIARKYGMVIVSPILERDVVHGDTLWNTAVVISNTGEVLGNSRKHHITRGGDYNESTYYMEGDSGHPVFHSQFGKVAVNICFGRNHPQHWMLLGLNGAEIVLNPCATIANPRSKALGSESTWGIPARNAAFANSYFTCAINRVGTEIFPNEFTSGDGQPPHRDFGPFFGSSYVAAPDGSRTPGLSRIREGLMVAQMDLNMCRQVEDSLGFRMTQRLDFYADAIKDTLSPDYKPPIIIKDYNIL